MTLHAIETVFHGYRFRSRLEARWAVVFDALGVAYRYESEGFDLGGVRYLPDFYLPALKWWVEIKPKRPTGADAQKCSRFGAALAHQRTTMVNQWIDDEGADADYPDPDEYAVFVGVPGEAFVIEYFGATPHADQDLAQCALCRRLIATTINEKSSWEGNGARWDVYHCEWCDTRDRLSGGYEADRAYFHKGDIVVGYDVRRSERLLEAYGRGRRARFERGEQP